MEIFAIIFALLFMACGSGQKAIKTPPPAPESARIAPPPKPAPPPAINRDDSAQEAAEWAARKLNPIYFNFDQAEIRADQHAVLARHADRLRENDLLIMIEGYCDERGTFDYNLALGMRRAESVRAFLIRAGIDFHRLSAISYGKERPAATGHDETAWSQNRRAAFIVTEP